MSEPNREQNVVVAGSFGSRNLPFIRESIRELTLAGARVVAPIFRTVNNPDAQFAILDTDDVTASPRQLEEAFMANIGRASLLVVVNHDPRRAGRVGLSAAAEIGWAAICGVPFTTTEAMCSKLPVSAGMYFANEVTADEAEALHRMCDRTMTEPLPETNPDYPVLVGLHDRLLAELATL